MGYSHLKRIMKKDGRKVCFLYQYKYIGVCRKHTQKKEKKQ